MSLNKIVEDSGVSSGLLSAQEVEAKSLWDVPCVGDALALLSVASLTILRDMLNLLKPLLQVSLISFTLKSASLGIKIPALNSNLRFLEYQIESAEKILDNLPTGVFKNCPVLDDFFTGILPTIQSKDLTSKFREISYELQQLLSIRDEIELAKKGINDTVQFLEVFLDQIEQKLEELAP